MHINIIYHRWCQSYAVYTSAGSYYLIVGCYCNWRCLLLLADELVWQKSVIKENISYSVPFIFKVSHSYNSIF